MGVVHEFFRHDLQEFLFDLIDVFPFRHFHAVGYAEDMCVDGHCWLSEDFVEDDIGGFSANTRQAHKLFAGLRDFAAEFINQDIGHGDNVFGFCVVKANGFNVIFERV